MQPGRQCPAFVVHHDLFDPALQGNRNALGGLPLASVLASGSLGVLMSWLMAWLVHGFGYGFLHVGFGLGLGILFGLVHGREGGEPRRIRNWRAISFRSLILRGLASGLAFGITVFLIVLATGSAYLLTFGLQNKFPDIMTGLIVGLIVAFLFGLKHEPAGETVYR